MYKFLTKSRILFNRSYTTIGNSTIATITKPRTTSIYIHWPYCSKICPYCSFNKYMDGPHVDHSAMKQSFLTELNQIVKKYYGENGSDLPKLTSIYFGGGTPSLAPVDTITSIVNESLKLFNVDRQQLLQQHQNDNHDHSLEITLEVNPDKIDIDKLSDFKNHSLINRVSLGVQAFNDKDLKFLGRTHTANDAKQAISKCNQLFKRVNFDLIYARHQNQTKEQWKQEINEAIDLCERGHISLYSLCFEEGTKLNNKKNNQIIPADHDLNFELYEIAKQQLERAGINQYEISNFSRENQRSRHNLNYWRGGDYIGIGPGACSRITKLDGTRHSLKCVLHPRSWITQVTDTGDGLDTVESKQLTIEERVNELLLMGLRTVEGVNRETFKSITNGKDIEDVLSATKLKYLISNGMLSLDNNRLCSTTKGFMLLDKIILEICL
ncbi:hypothetical protein PPL_10571 [Heterostelium album PN500]|uniref:Radical S-adenosyl methionine domain-containing protein 1, mitochondrial n=1 Tax=Heterostelium pallidum (strain ATCC 26659 / Pp 5 / PN500) TaxID=670386 RepID=D3BRG1_HETP5|nr:hypothetical protein PPL_10571 [Heterostelium album PN500]EFA75993.1 hypothetical protein PPL_10571 [Heterostelium album PN500]|eukprot:XP_020428127.1 hypothetical protein PPL_10571 [Heterostelium album PN500]